MRTITISNEIHEACPNLRVLAIDCQVRNTPSDTTLWHEINAIEEEIRSSVRLEMINKWAPIQATRQAYKKLGKDPNRYRPSAEALRRRVVRSLPLYQVDTLVDLINLVSLQSGYSIGGFDAEKINGDLRLGVGQEGELYHGIGRGVLNISGLPVYRDQIGGIGTPTSDEERTKIDARTAHLLMLINGYSGIEGLLDAGRYAVTLLRKYAFMDSFEANLIAYGFQESVSL